MNKFHLQAGLAFMTIMLVFVACQNNSTRVDEEVTIQPKKAHPATAKTNQTRNTDPNRKIVTEHLDTGGLKWMTMEEAGKLNNKEGKKFLIDVYTDWCGWCKIMDKKTFGDPIVKAYLEENYHLVKFNSEQHDPIVFRGKTYEWAPIGKNGINKLSYEIMESQLSYPTLVFLDENLEKISATSGYKKPDQLMAELKRIDNS